MYLTVYLCCRSNHQVHASLCILSLMIRAGMCLVWTRFICFGNTSSGYLSNSGYI